MSDTDKYPSICAAVKEARDSGYRGEIAVDPDEAADLLADLDTANARADEAEAERDWLAQNAYANYCPEYPPERLGDDCSITALVVEDGDCPLGIRVDDPEHCPKCWLAAVREAVRR